MPVLRFCSICLRFWRCCTASPSKDAANAVYSSLISSSISCDSDRSGSKVNVTSLSDLKVLFWLVSKLDTSEITIAWSMTELLSADLRCHNPVLGSYTKFCLATSTGSEVLVSATKVPKSRPKPINCSLNTPVSTRPSSVIVALLLTELLPKLSFTGIPRTRNWWKPSPSTSWSPSTALKRRWRADWIWAPEPTLTPAFLFSVAFAVRPVVIGISVLL